MSSIERQQGLTLVELIVFILIVGVALAGVTSIFIQVSRSSADPLIRKQALSVAESLMEEIQAVSYSCPGGATCNAVTTANRTLTHEVDDYSGFTMTGISAIDGTAVPQLAGYTATVTVGAEAAWSGANGRQISITVSSGNESVTLTGWRGKY